MPKSSLQDVYERYTKKYVHTLHKLMKVHVQSSYVIMIHLSTGHNRRNMLQDPFQIFLCALCELG